MGNSISNRRMDRSVDLAKQAEDKFPYPLNACVFVKKKINWLREMWVAEQHSLQNS